MTNTVDKAKVRVVRVVWGLYENTKNAYCITKNAILSIAKYNISLRLHS